MSFVAFLFHDVAKTWRIVCEFEPITPLVLGFCLTVVPLAWCLSPPALACRVQYLFQK